MFKSSSLVRINAFGNGARLSLSNSDRLLQEGMLAIIISAYRGRYHDVFEIYVMGVRGICHSEYFDNVQT
jgi:hypothetical protein